MTSMTYDVARSAMSGLYWGGPLGHEGFVAEDPADATAFGDAHRAYTDLLDQTTEEVVWVSYTAE